MANKKDTRTRTYAKKDDRHDDDGVGRCAQIAHPMKVNDVIYLLLSAFWL